MVVKVYLGKGTIAEMPEIVNINGVAAMVVRTLSPEGCDVEIELQLAPPAWPAAIVESAAPQEPATDQADVPPSRPWPPREG